MTAIKHDLEAPSMLAPDHVYSVLIRATPDRIWRAITDGMETERYYFGTRVDSDWSVGGTGRLCLSRTVRSPPTARSSRSTRAAGRR